MTNGHTDKIDNRESACCLCGHVAFIIAMGQMREHYQIWEIDTVTLLGRAVRPCHITSHFQSHSFVTTPLFVICHLCHLCHFAILPSSFAIFDCSFALLAFILPPDYCTFPLAFLIHHLTFRHHFHTSSVKALNPAPRQQNVYFSGRGGWVHSFFSTCTAMIQTASRWS